MSKKEATNLIGLNRKDINIGLLKKYSELLLKFHDKKENENGYELNDRRFFIDYILKGLGYLEDNLLIDVPQNTSQGSRSADIRIYGDMEIKNKNSHSQFIIETKNYKLYNRGSIDFLQLKRYIKYNEAKIRLIAATDYELLYVFNATLIKKNTAMDFSNLDTISQMEINIFTDNLLYEINLINIENNQVYLSKLTYEKVFGEQKFINPAEYESTNSIYNASVRKNFILVLYNLMIRLQKQIFPVFDLMILDLVTRLEGTNNKKKILNQTLQLKEFKPVLDYLLWCIEMNYLEDFIQDNTLMDPHAILNILNNREKKDGFVLASVYNLINKLMFIRILEDTSTSSTRFIVGMENGRYISNGILEKKRKEGKKALSDYIVSLFNFEQDDFEPYSFILSKDIYIWILLFSDDLISDLLIELIRLFNDTNFKRVSQDLLGDIYEHYLEQEEDESSQKTYRRLLGQYYTPKPIVRMMWFLTREVLKKTQGRDLYEKDAPYLDIIDPACGSGTFIVEGALHVNESYSRKKISKDGKVYSFIKNEYDRLLANHLYGFELNPLSKTICDINVFFALVQTYGMDNLSKNEITNLHTYRTDSLDYTEKNGNNDTLPNFMLAQEIKDSIVKKTNLEKAKNKEFDIVIGNPPYGHMSSTSTIKNLLIPFAYAENNYDFDEKITPFLWNNRFFKGNVPSIEKNLGKMSDLYAFFFGAADRLVKNNGIVSFITSNTYLTIPTYKWFRKYLLENYQIEYIINFNPVSSRENSMFYPDASIATSIIIMQKKKPLANHEINVLDLSGLKSIKDKYDYFADIEWTEGKENPNKNDIKFFSIKKIDSLNFNQVLQRSFLDNIDYAFNLQADEKNEILTSILGKSVRITSLTPKQTGVDVGDLDLLVAETKEEIKDKIQNYVFTQKLSGFNKTSVNKIIESFEKGTLSNEFDEEKIKKFIFQSSMEPFYYDKNSYTYHDNTILWRSRLPRSGNTEDAPINRKNKLLIREKRGAKSSIVSVVDNCCSLPQHGGRFMYLVDNEKVKETDLYVLSAMINSKVGQFIYRFGMQGNKEIYVIDPRNISKDLYECILNTSQEIHHIYRDMKKFDLGDKEFTSIFFNNIEGIRDGLFCGIDDNSMYSLHFTSSMYFDYQIDNPKLIENHKIRINDSLVLKFKVVNEDIEKRLTTYLCAFNGTSLEDLTINSITLTGQREEFDNNAKIHINCLISQLNDFIDEAYEINSDQKRVINESLL